MTLPINRERRIKKHILGKTHTVLIRFPRGLGEPCWDETRETASIPVMTKEAKTIHTRLESAAVLIEDLPYREMLALPLRMRTAREMLWPVVTAKADSHRDLKNAITRVPWGLYLPERSRLSLRVSSTASRLYHEGMIRNLVSETLQAGRFEVDDARTAPYLIDVRLHQDVLTLSLSLASRPLYQRGYKSMLKATAPLKEDLAAGAIWAALSHAKAGNLTSFDTVFVPFAGSGTLGFEAALLLGRMPPALFLPPLSVETFACTPPETAAYCRRYLLDLWAREGRDPPPVRFVECDPSTAAHLRKNISAFATRAEEVRGVPPVFDLIEGDAHDGANWPQDARSTLVLLNPPYGERLKDRLGTSGGFARLAENLRAFANRSAIAGCAFVPSEAAEQALRAATSKLAWGSMRISHGGRPTTLLLFRSAHI